MNERIKQILTSPALVRLRDWSDIGPAQRAELEEFAELILTDCIKVVDETPLGYGDYRDQILESMRNSCVESIKYRFGVK